MSNTATTKTLTRILHSEDKKIITLDKEHRKAITLLNEHSEKEVRDELKAIYDSSSYEKVEIHWDIPLLKVYFWFQSNCTHLMAGHRN